MKARSKYMMLALSAAVLAGAWFLAEVMEEQAPPAVPAGGEMAEEPVISLGPGGELTALSWSWAGETVNLRREGAEGRWVNADDAACPVDQETAEALAEAAASVTAAETISGVADLSEYGLEGPPLTVVAATESAMARYDVSDMTAAGTYYARVNGENTVYAIGGELPTAFRRGVGDILALERVPEDMERVTGLSVSSEAESYTLEYTASGEAGWYRTDGPAPEPLDGERVRRLYELATELPLERCVAWDGAEARELGFGRPQAEAVVTYRDRAGGEKSFTLEFGDYAEDGVYVRFAGSALIYLTGAEALDGLMYPRWEAMTPETVLTVDREAVSSILLRLEGRSYEIVRLEEKTERAVGNGTETVPVTDVIYSCNGWVLDTEAVEDWLAALGGLQTDGEEPVGEGRQTLLRAVIAWKDGEAVPAELELRSYDSVHSLCILGGRYALVPREAGEALAEGARAMLEIRG